jgi:hypothetical protein
MALRMVVSAKGVSVMVSVAAIARIGEENIFMGIIANPVPAAFRFREILRFAA